MVRGGIARLVVFSWLAVVPHLAASQLVAADAEVRIEPREKWSAVFGEADVKFTFDVSSAEPLTGRLNWSLSANQRSLVRGTSRVDARPGKPGSVTVPLRIPNVKDGVVFGAQLTVTVNVDNDRQAAAEFVKPIWIFPPRPFADRSEWLKKLNITLYDPEGQTAAIFDQAEIPYTASHNTTALAELRNGLLVVGEGVSLRDHRELAELLMTVAASGVPVLCLAPADGSIPCLGAPNDNQPIPAGVSLKRSSVIGELDKRLDSRAWPPDGKLMASGFVLKADRQQVVAEVSRDDAQAWPWLEVRYPDKGATLLCCGFGIIQHWDAGPTPRYLLARLFESLTEKPTLHSTRSQEE